MTGRLLRTVKVLFTVFAVAHTMLHTIYLLRSGGQHPVSGMLMLALTPPSALVCSDRMTGSSASSASAITTPASTPASGKHNPT